jgi:hypothetical protein
VSAGAAADDRFAQPDVAQTYDRVGDIGMARSR